MQARVLQKLLGPKLCYHAKLQGRKLFWRQAQKLEPRVKDEAQAYAQGQAVSWEEAFLQQKPYFQGSFALKPRGPDYVGAQFSVVASPAGTRTLQENSPAGLSPRKHRCKAVCTSH